MLCAAIMALCRKCANKKLALTSLTVSWRDAKREAYLVKLMKEASESIVIIPQMMPEDVYSGRNEKPKAKTSTRALSYQRHLRNS